MTYKRVARRAGLLRLVAGNALLMTGLLLAGCARPVAGSKLRTYAADLAGGAMICKVPSVNPAAGATSDVAMNLANDGGWCGIRVHQPGPKPFGAGLLMVRPDHGAVTIHQVGDDTRVDYTPERGFAGGDAFAVKLLPGDAVLDVKVAVSPPEKAAARPVS